MTTYQDVERARCAHGESLVKPCGECRAWVLEFKRQTRWLDVAADLTLAAVVVVFLLIGMEVALR